MHGFLLGTDQIGRDLLVRIAYGARISLFVGILTTAVAAVLGVTIGMVAGYFGGAVDAILARLIDAALAFPFIVLALALAAVFNPSLTIVIGVITFFSWAGISRIVRGQTLSLKEKEYIEAARSLGAGPWRIMFVDILPNLLGPVLVLATLYIPTAVTFEATLSFLGIGIPEPAPSWGNILGEAQSFYQIAWWYVVFPAAALLHHHPGLQPPRRRHPRRHGPPHRAAVRWPEGQARQAGARTAAVAAGAKSPGREPGHDHRGGLGQ